MFFSLAQCPANEVRTESSGVILSPGYPGNYFNSQTCSWSIKVEPKYNITIFVDTFQSEKQFDALEVFDGKFQYSFFFLTYQWPLHSIIKIPSRCFCYTRTLIYSWVKLYLPQTENELFLHLCSLKSLYNMNILLLMFQLLSN